MCQYNSQLAELIKRRPAMLSRERATRVGNSASALTATKRGSGHPFAPGDIPLLLAPFRVKRRSVEPTTCNALFSQQVSSMVRHQNIVSLYLNLFNLKLPRQSCNIFYLPPSVKQLNNF